MSLLKALDELETELSRLGVRPQEHFRPGLAETTIVELTARHGLQLSDESIAWWHWHNGSVGHLRPGEGALWLERSLEIYQWRRDQADIAAADPQGAESLRDPSIWWHPQWLPFNHTSGPHLLVIDCSTHSTSSPLRHIDWGIIATPGYADPLWPSISAWVSGLLVELRGDRYRYDPKRGMISNS